MARANMQPIIIRKIDELPDHGHHGGAWKVAYADFMTAMMAFFLLMWIISNATKDQLNGISDYFTPAKVSMTAKGGTGALGGTTLGPKGVMNASNGVSKPQGMETGKPEKPTPATHPLPQITEKKQPAASSKSDPKASPVPGKGATVVKMVSEHARDKERFKKVQKDIVAAIKAEPDLRPLLKNVLFKQTPDGLNIEVVDQAGRAMFASGSAKIEGATLLLMQRLARVISTLPNKIRISGHTDSVPFAEGASHDNWDLSSERANATRRVFVSSGIDSTRITRISGVADTEPLKPEDPRDPSNRRITVLLAYQNGSTPESQAAAAAALSKVAEPTAPGISIKAETAPPAATAPATGDHPPAAPAVDQAASAAPAANGAAAAPAQAAQAAPATQQSALEKQYSLITPEDIFRKP